MADAPPLEQGDISDAAQLMTETPDDEVYQDLLRTIDAYGFEKPSAIQQRGTVIQQAQSGTDKTAISCSSIIQQLDYSLLECQAIVLAPTRELAQHIEKVMLDVGDYLGIQVHACVGSSARDNQRILQAGVHVVVGTPGRVFNILRRNCFIRDNIKMLVLHEAVQMLSGRFRDQIYNIFDTLIPLKIQVSCP